MFRRRRFLPVLARILDFRIRQQVLVVDRDDRQTLAPSDIARQRLEVRAHQLDLPLVGQLHQPGGALARLRRGDQIFRHRAPVTHPVVHVGEAQAVNLSDFEIPAQVLQAAIERNHADLKSDRYPPSSPWP